MTREELRQQKIGARKALEYTMRPIATCVGPAMYAALLSSAVDSIFEADEAFYCAPPPQSGTDVVPASREGK